MRHTESSLTWDQLRIAIEEVLCYAKMYSIAWVYVTGVDSFAFKFEDSFDTFDRANIANPPPRLETIASEYDNKPTEYAIVGKIIYDPDGKIHSAYGFCRTARKPTEWMQ